MTLATDLACDLGHEFPRSNLEITFFEISDFRILEFNKGHLFGWLDILLTICDLRFAFITYRRAVQV